MKILDALVLLILIYACVQDIKSRKVNNMTFYGLSILVLVKLCYLYFTGEWYTLFFCLISGALCFLVHMVIMLLSKNGRIGGMDTKMTSLICTYVGLWCSILLNLTSLIVVGIYKIYKKYREKIIVHSSPFMLPLMVGYFVCMLVL